MENKFCMTQEDNIFMAKRTLVDSIYQQANLEGIAVTFAETHDILNNVNVAHLTPNEISKVCCLRDGWHYLFDNLDKPVDLAFLAGLHELVARFDVPYQYLGVWRTDEVAISGTRWRPELPDPEKVHSKLQEFSRIENITERALTTGLWLMRCQLFKDGNKRIGSFVINKILIENGAGIFNIPLKLDGIFKQKLVDYYESEDSSELSEWIWEECLDGTGRIQKDIEHSF